MNVLILGSGGRESALAWKIAGSKKLGKLFCMPGNPGTSAFAVNVDGNIKDFDAIRKAVIDNDIDMVVVGPEEPLVNGLRDYFAADMELSSVMFIGPSASGAELEGSKDFAKDFMTAHGIPTAAHFTCTASTMEEGFSFLSTLKPPYVLKADGLAAGKGVLIVDDIAQARKSLEEMLGGKFGEASSKVVIEEYLSGIELSVFVLTDGKSYMILPEAKDYKRIGEGDTGLNTGGMGAVSPVPFADEAFMKKVEDRIIRPTIAGLEKDGIEYAGFIFIGLMNCSGEPYVVEYNVRMGDPETEAVMTRIDSDLLSHLEAAACGRLSSEKISISPSSAVTVVAVSGGYPGSYRKGIGISLPECFDAVHVHGEDHAVESGSCGTGSVCKKEAAGNPRACGNAGLVGGNTVLFHSGTAMENGRLVTSGGRVLAVTSLSRDLKSAAARAYENMSLISFDGMYYRHDIAEDVMKYRHE